MTTFLASFSPLVLGQLSTGELIVLASLVFIGGIVFFGMWMSAQETKQKQATLREAVRLCIETGKPLPEGLIPPENASPEVKAYRRQQRAHVELFVGLVLLAVGGGLFFIVPSIAPMVAFLGVAFLIASWWDRR